MKRILSVTLVLALALVLGLSRTARAASETAYGTLYEYSIADGEAIVTTCNTAYGDIVIPDTLGGCPVVSIGPGAFTKIDGRGPTGVTFPKSVRRIEHDAFGGLETLTTVTFPADSELTYIGPWAFCRSALLEVTLPKNVKELGQDAFAYCLSMEALTLNDGLEVIGTRAIANCPLITSLVIPDSVTELGDRSICYNNALEHLTLGGSYDHIYERTLAENFAIDSLVIPEGVVSLDGMDEMPTLRELHIPASVTEILTIGPCNYFTVEPYSMIIYGESGSYAEQWAEENGYFFREEG